MFSCQFIVGSILFMVVLPCEMQIGFCYFFFFQAEDGIRYLVRSRGLGDVYKRQLYSFLAPFFKKG